jgi:hypothetical protein
VHFPVQTNNTSIYAPNELVESKVQNNQLISRANIKMVFPRHDSSFGIRLISHNYLLSIYFRYFCLLEQNKATPACCPFLSLLASSRAFLR